MPEALTITPKAAFLNRRQIMQAALGLGALGLGPAQAAALTPNSLEDITSYNNFYEFGWEKTDPAQYAHEMSVEPWSVEIGGLVEAGGVFSLPQLLAMAPLQERVYRFRCVEAWSMVIPWQGVELGQILRAVKPRPEARYVAFTSLHRPEEMRGQRAGGIKWPYVEGLRLDEALHPLTLLATGLYGEPMPKQNGAPIRLVVPWKYGFKSAKSLVKIELVAEEPRTTWKELASDEYGFYANVNPNVDHPRWSQATERKIGAGVFAPREPTLMFNGYDEVASLYQGMDLAQSY